MKILNTACKLSDHILSSGIKSCRKLAEKFRISKSSIHRKKKRIKERQHIIGASFFESIEGQQWLSRMVVACIFIFGNIAGVGAERISHFFSLVCVTAFIGLSRCSVAKIENNIDDMIIKFKSIYDKMIKEKAHELEITPGGDETFFTNQMLIVLMELKSGFIFVEKPEESRDHKTWENNSAPWLSEFKLVRCFVSDKAKALLKLAKTTLGVSRIPDLFHMMNDVSKVMKFSFSRLKKRTEKSIEDTCKLISKGVNVAQNKMATARLKLELRAILIDQGTYQRNQRALSTSLHPFSILTAKKQNSKDVEASMLSCLGKIKLLKEKHEISDSGKKLARVERQIPDSAKLVDQWWGWTESSLDSSDITPELKDWLLNNLLPYIYWSRQIKKTSSKKIRRCYEISARVARQKLEMHILTKRLISNEVKKSDWIKWAENMSDMFIRTTSPIEGRNGWLSQIHFNGRGLSEKRVQSQAGIHNYYLKRSNDSTACERLSGIKPEDMFGFIMQHINPLPEPRNGKGKKMLDPLGTLTVPG